MRGVVEDGLRSWSSVEAVEALSGRLDGSYSYSTVPPRRVLDMRRLRVDSLGKRDSFKWVEGGGYEGAREFEDEVDARVCSGCELLWEGIFNCVCIACASSMIDLYGPATDDDLWPRACKRWVEWKSSIKIPMTHRARRMIIRVS